MLGPVAREIVAPAYPDAVVLLQVIEKRVQAADTARPADQPRMQADGHHLRPRLAFRVENIETVLEVGKEFLA